MLSFQSLVLATTLLSQLMLSNAFILPKKVAIKDSILSVSENFEFENPQDGVVEMGSHEELMYSLGVNLARQLGDIRPLVENSDELTHVAKGLLDTVIGRLDDEAQRKILSKVSSIIAMRFLLSPKFPHYRSLYSAEKNWTS